MKQGMVFMHRKWDTTSKRTKKKAGSKSGAYKEHLEEGSWCGKAAGLGVFVHTLLQKFQ